MKKLIELYKCSNPWLIYRNGTNFGQFFGIQSRTLTVSAPSEDTITAPRTSLYGRLAPAGDPRISVVPILDQWFEEGGQIDPEDLHNIVRQFRKTKRFKHCLQIVQWMSDKNVVDPSPKDVAVQLDLISKVYGVEQAESYFDSVPNTLKVWQVYGALLNCYAKAKLVGKAEATMQKMKDLGSVRSLSYNIMLTLYAHLGNHEKLNLLVKEMDETGIHCDNYTYNIRLNAYGDSKDIKQMEMLLMKMEADPVITMDWQSYNSAAIAYKKAGATEKVLETLKKAEHVIRGDKRFAYEGLLTLYAGMGKKDEVYRIWNLNKKSGKFYNMTYRIMISSLCKLNDLEGAEKILEEWEEGQKYYDYRLPIYLITAFCKKGLMEKAELIVDQLVESGRKPNASTLYRHISLGYLKHNHMEKAVETLKKGIAVSKPPRTPDITTLASCLDYLHGKGDTDGAEEIAKSLQEKGFAYEGLLILYASMGKKDEVYRIWNLHKKSGKFYNMTYQIMISSLSTLNDLEGAEKILEEWEEGQKYYDYRLPIDLITAFCKKGLVEKAELIVEKLVKSGRKPNTGTLYSRISLCYLKHNLMEKAVETLKKEIAVCKSPTPDIDTLVSCLDYLHGKGDTDGAEEIIKSLQEKGVFTMDYLHGKGDTDGAEEILKSIQEKSMKKGNQNLRDSLKGDMDGAEETSKKEIAGSKPPRTPDITTLASCLDYLHGKGDTDGAEEIIKSLQEKGIFTRNLYDKLVKVMKKGNQIPCESFDMVGDSPSCQEANEKLPAEENVKI